MKQAIKYSSPRKWVETT